MKRTIVIVLAAISVQLAGCSDKEKDVAAQVLEEKLQSNQDFRDRRKAELETTVKVFKSISFVDPETDNRPSDSQQIIDEIKLKRYYRIKARREAAEARGEFIHSFKLLDQDAETDEYKKEQERLRYAYGGKLPLE